MVKKPFMYITDINKQMSDEYAKALISFPGTFSIVNIIIIITPLHTVLLISLRVIC